MTFKSLKQLLIEAPVLGYPRPEGKHVLDTDASNHAVGAVLSQEQDGVERVLAYYSQTHSQPERQYCMTRKELLAVVKVIRQFHVYLYGHPFTICTDHAALKWLLNFRIPEGQVARWLQQLQEYDFVIEHQSGLKHVKCCHTGDRMESKEHAAKEASNVEGENAPCAAVERPILVSVTSLEIHSSTQQEGLPQSLTDLRVAQEQGYQTTNQLAEEQVQTTVEGRGTLQ